MTVYSKLIFFKIRCDIQKIKNTHDMESCMEKHKIYTEFCLKCMS